MNTTERFPNKVTDDPSLDEMFFGEAPTISPKLEQECLAEAERPWNELSIREKMARAEADLENNPAYPGHTKRESYPPPTSSAELASTAYPPLTYTVDKLVMGGRPQTLDGDG